MSTEIIKSPYDKREYKYVKLDNDLNVVIIQDKEISYSAASMVVGVGCFYDPWEYQGLSHFLEHMLFMGTTKFPDENYFSKYINDHGGFSNAYTADEYTNYYFQVQHSGFQNTLDIFSRFFIDPLMKKDSIDREINAIQSEHSKNITNDHWRMQGLLDHLSHEKSIWHKFGTGNLDTLNKPEIYDALLKHHKKYYSANNMYLTVISSSTIDDTHQLIKEYFSEIINNDINYLHEIIPNANNPQAFPCNDFVLSDTPITLSRKSNTCLTVKLKPVDNDYMLNMLWEVPSDLHFYKHNIMGFISYLIGDETKGSIIYTLKEHELANSLHAGKLDNNRFINKFDISINLTEKGFTYQAEIVRLVHTYIDLLRTSPFPETLYNEYITLQLNSFYFRSKPSEDDIVIECSSNMLYYPVEDILRTSVVRNKYDEKTLEYYNSYFKILKPESCIVVLAAPPYDKELTKHESKYDIKFFAEYDYVFSDSDKPTLVFNVDMPKENKFIPTSFEIYDQELSKQPIKIDHSEIDCWYKFSNKYMLPKGSVILALHTDNLITTIDQYIKLNMYIVSKLEELNDEAYQSSVAGIHFAISFDKHDQTIYIHVNGYTEKLHMMYNFILTKLKHGLTNENSYNITKEQFKITQKNTYTQTPSNLVFHYLYKHIDKSFYDPQDLLKSLKNISYNDVNIFGHAIFNSTFSNCKLFVGGNVTSDQVNDYIITTEPFAKKATYDTHNIKCINPTYKHHIIYKVPNDTENDSCILLVYPCKHVVFTSDSDWKEILIATHLTKYMMSDDFFDTLRTKEQLGYKTYMSTMKFDTSYNPLYGLMFLIQSNVKDPDYLHERINKFMQSFYDTSVNTLTDDTLNTHINTYIENLKKPYDTITEDLRNDFMSINRENYMFDYKQQLLDRVKTYTVDEYKTFFNKYIMNSTPMTVKLFGNRFLSEYDALIGKKNA